MAVCSSTAHDPERWGARAPIRTCIGCRQQAAAAELLRVVAAGGQAPDEPVQVVPDPRRRAPGRGAWLHPVPRCLELAERRRAFGRALRIARAAAPLDPTPVREYVAALSRSTEVAHGSTPTGGTPQE